MSSTSAEMPVLHSLQVSQSDVSWVLTAAKAHGTNVVVSVTASWTVLCRADSIAQVCIVQV